MEMQTKLHAPNSVNISITVKKFIFNQDIHWNIETSGKHLRFNRHIDRKESFRYFSPCF